MPSNDWLADFPPEQRQEILLQRQEEAVWMRIGGMTLQAIADECGYGNATGVQRAIVRYVFRAIRKNVHPDESLEDTVYRLAERLDPAKLPRCVPTMSKRTLTRRFIQIYCEAIGI